MNRLDGKVARISGAARGIGGETARLMVEVGATAAIGDCSTNAAARPLARSATRLFTSISTRLARRIGPPRSPPL